MHPLIQVNLLGVDVTVEVDDSNLFVAEMAANPSYGGESDGVVTAEDDREGPAGEHVGDALRDLIEALFVIRGNREDVTHIAQGDLFPQIHPHFVVVGGVQS